jgi:hypothetical protein
MAANSVYIVILLTIILFLIILKYVYVYDIIWTCAAYFDYNNGERWDEFQNAMDSIVRLHTPETLHKIQRWIVVNEYDAHPKHDYAAVINEKYPWVTYVQKPPGQKGISESINWILRSYVPYSRLWIHWEETWVARKPFLDRAIALMNTKPEITQLTFIYKNGRTEWSDIDPDRLKCTDDYCLVKPHPDRAWYSTWDGSAEGMNAEVTAKWAITWPLYQLLPSINRSAFYTGLPYFHTSRKHAEWLYARSWLRAGGVKAIFKDAPVWRPTEKTHVSTHA